MVELAPLNPLLVSRSPDAHIRILPSHMAAAVPDHPVWLHEVYDGYRLRLEREGNRVRLFSRNGRPWRLGVVAYKERARA